jgi:hypothetical protein
MEDVHATDETKFLDCTTEFLSSLFGIMHRKTSKSAESLRILLYLCSHVIICNLCQMLRFLFIRDPLWSRRRQRLSSIAIPREFHQSEMFNIVSIHQVQSFTVNIEQHILKTRSSSWFRVICSLSSRLRYMNCLFNGNFAKLSINLFLRGRVPYTA